MIMEMLMKKSRIFVDLWKILFVVLFLSIPVYITACGDDPVSSDPATETEAPETETEEEEEELESETEEGFGSVSGIVTATNGITPIQGALVRLKTNSESSNYSGPEDITDIDGRYTLENVPAGEQTLVAIRGVFRAEKEVVVVADMDLEVSEFILTPAEKLAYIPGDFDSIEDILKDELGMEMDVHIEEITYSDLLSFETLSQYDIVFLNCGSDVAYEFEDEADAEALREYISSGGLLYLSDLEMPLLWILFPDEFPFDLNYYGIEGTITADVTFNDLSSFIGKSTVDIFFNFDDWMGLIDQTLSDEIVVLLRGDYLAYDFDMDDEFLVSNEPLAILYRYGEGALIFTSFHNTGAATTDQRSVLNFYVFGFGGFDVQAELQPFAVQSYPEIKAGSREMNQSIRREHAEAHSRARELIRLRNR
jgi:hypothetical protein